METSPEKQTPTWLATTVGFLIIALALAALVVTWRFVSSFIELALTGAVLLIQSGQMPLDQKELVVIIFCALVWYELHGIKHAILDLEREYRYRKDLKN